MPNDKSLAFRDPAQAALLGLLPGAGADFGAEFGGYYGYGAEFGDEYAGDYGADAIMPSPQRPVRAAPMSPSHPAHPSNPMHAAHVQATMANHARAAAVTASRELLLEPNKGSATKVERYDFSLNAALVLGTAIALNMSLQPSVTLRPQRLITNAPSPGFALFTTIQVANVAVTVGASTDAYSYGSGAFGSFLDCPTLSPANRATIAGNYSGLVPPGFAPAWAYTLVATFQGPATIVA